MNTFIKATINGRSIYIKIDTSLIYTEHTGKPFIEESIIDILHDNSYTITTSTPEEWDYMIEYGLSYEIDSFEEVEEFKEINMKVKEIRNEA